MKNRFIWLIGGFLTGSLSTLYLAPSRPATAFPDPYALKIQRIGEQTLRLCQADPNCMDLEEYE